VLIGGPLAGDNFGSHFESTIRMMQNGRKRDIDKK
jgi:hypothetical protein